MLPGKKYTVDDVIDILRRRYWLLLVPCAVVGAVVAAYTRTLPNVYQSETVIMIQPQSVPESYVQSTVTTPIEDRLPTLRATILSRTRLERIIEQFDLYPEMRQTGPMEDVVERMKNNISTSTASGNTFIVGFRGNDPVQVMKVTDSLASLFINDTLAYRQSQAEGTNQFLDAQLNEALAKLREQERKLAAWQLAHAGEAPDALTSNLQQMQNANMGLRDVRVSMSDDRARRLELERQLGDLQDPLRAADVPPADTTSTTQVAAPSALSQQLSQAEAQLSAYQQRGLRPGHPDLDAAQRRVNDLRARVSGEAMPGTGPASSRPVMSAAEWARERRITDLKAQISQIDKQLARWQEDEKKLLGDLAATQTRVDATPIRQTELIELTRDYQVLRGSYERLLSNKQQSQIAADLERRQAGEQFKLMDPARLPERPISPNPPRIIMLGLVAGLLFGLGIVALVEYRDKSFKLDQDVAGMLDLPVLAVIPTMKSDADLRRALFRNVFTSASLGGIVAAGFTFVVYVLVS